MPGGRRTHSGRDPQISRARRTHDRLGRRRTYLALIGLRRPGRIAHRAVRGFQPQLSKPGTAWHSSSSAFGTETQERSDPDLDARLSAGDAARNSQRHGIAESADPAIRRSTGGAPGRCLIDMARKTISIVTPCYNEEGNVEELYRRTRAVMEEFPQYNYEHIFIDNSSGDRTVAILDR